MGGNTNEIYYTVCTEHATYWGRYKGSYLQASTVNSTVALQSTVSLCYQIPDMQCSDVSLHKIIAEVVQQFAVRWNSNAIYGRLWRQSRLELGR